jgi:hypothetical protein
VAIARTVDASFVDMGCLYFYCLLLPSHLDTQQLSFVEITTEIQMDFIQMELGKHKNCIFRVVVLSLLKSKSAENTKFDQQQSKSLMSAPPIFLISGILYYLRIDISDSIVISDTLSL